MSPITKLAAAIVVGISLVLPAAGQETFGGLSGVVLDDKGQPVPRAQIVVRSDRLPLPRRVIADERAEFMLGALPAGSYRLEAIHPGFLRTPFGARRYGQPGTSITVSGRIERNLRVVLLRASTVDGEIRDRAGAPLAGAVVTLLRAMFREGQERFEDRGLAAVAGGDGRYRLVGVPPGRYLAVATRSELGREQPRVRQLSKGDVDRVIAGGTLPVTTTDAPSAFVAYWTSVWPTGTEPTSASVIELDAGDRREGIDFVLERIPVTDLTVQVTYRGQPHADAVVTLEPVTRLGQSAAFPYASGARLGPRKTGSDGMVSFHGMPITSHRVQVRAESAGETKWAQHELGPVREKHIVLALGDSARIYGRVHVQRSSTDQDTVPRMRAWIRSEGGGLSEPIATEVAPSGDFQFLGIAPGRYTAGLSFSTQAEKEQWGVAGLSLADTDPSEVGFEVAPGGVRGPLTFAVVDDLPAVSGQLLGDADVPLTEYFVIVFSADERAASGTRAVRPDSQGRYRVGPLPAGTYRLAVVDDVEDGEWFRPAFLQSLVGASLPIKLERGQKTTLDLRVPSR